MAKREHFTLVGGPADGLEVDLEDPGDLVRWKATTDQDLVLMRMNRRQPSEHDHVLYRRSKRSRNLFVYQP